MVDAGHGGKLQAEHFYGNLADDDIPEDLQELGFVDYRWFGASPYAVLALAKRGARGDDWAAYIAGVPASADLNDAIVLVWGSAAKLPRDLATLLFPRIAESGLVYRD